LKSEPYFPPPESQGGWRWLDSASDVRTVARMDPNSLDLVRQNQELLHSDDSWGIVITRHG